MLTDDMSDVSVKALLQGKWLGHPLHPALVHVPTGLWPAALVFDLINYFGPAANSLVRTSFACIAVALLAALTAVPTGLADWWDIKPGKPARTLGLWHMALNVLVVVLMAAGLWLRWRGGLDIARVTAPQLGLCAVANAVLFVSGYLGGRMVFDNGIGVGRMSKTKWRQIAREGHARVPPVET